MDSHCPVSRSSHHITEQVNGEILCTQCGIVIQQDLITTEELGTFTDHQFQTSTSTNHVAKALHANPHSTQVWSLKQKQNALIQLRGDATVLEFPEGYLSRVQDLFIRVMESSSTFKWGTQSRLVGVVCIVLISRTIGGGAILLNQASCKLYLDPVSLGRYLVKVRPFIVSSFSDYAPDSIQNMLRPLTMDEDLGTYVDQLLTQMYQHGQPTVDELIHAFLRAKPTGDTYKQDWFQPVPDTRSFSVLNYRHIVNTLLRTCSHLFQSRHPMPCALAIACVAREAVEQTPCSASIWSTLLNLTESPTTSHLRQREIHDALASAASMLPWHSYITVRSYSTKSYPTIAFFVAQIIDLIHARVLTVFGEPPSRTRSRRANEILHDYVTRAITRLDKDFGVTVHSDIQLLDPRVNDIPTHSTHNITLLIDDLDLAVESLLLSRKYKVSELLGLHIRDIIPLSENLDIEVNGHNIRDLDNPELNSDDE